MRNFFLRLRRRFIGLNKREALALELFGDAPILELREATTLDAIRLAMLQAHLAVTFPESEQAKRVALDNTN